MEVNTKTPLTPPGSPGSDFAAETDGFGLSPHREPVLSDHDDICVGNTVETPAGFVHRGHVSGRRWIVLSLFLAAYVLNQWDRYMINYLSAYVVPECAAKCSDVVRRPCEPCSAGEHYVGCMECSNCLQKYHAAEYNIQEATCLTETQYGMLTGVAFVLVYVLFGFVAGRAADNFPRRSVAVGGIFLWSISTGLQALVSDFGGLLVVRLALGVGEAFLVPSVFSLVRDLFPPSERPFANSLFTVGVYFGGGLASLSILLSASIGWRATSVAAGVLGIVNGLLVLIISREPPRGGLSAEVDGGTHFPVSHTSLPDSPSQDSAESGGLQAHRGSGSSSRWSESAATGSPVADNFLTQTIGATLEVLSYQRMRYLLIGAMMRFFAGYAISAFLVKYFATYFPDDNSSYSVANAVVVSLAGSVSAVGGGYIVSKQSRKHPMAQVWIPAVGSALAVPCMAGVLLCESFTCAMVFLFLEYLTAECWLGPIVSLAQATVPANMIGVATSVFIAATTLAGSLAPVVVGAVEDAIGDATSTRWILLVAVCVPYASASWVFLATAKTSSRRDGD